ncbi:hypothetical protein [Nocardioides bruguierae]|uniref:hypothetical protein n=1 Tax=Nocardioides bruguierae TaxID=2945102 RepID=UPI0020209E13|nr:hypothetical protein [Nocardioides bruguierae]
MRRHRPSPVPPPPVVGALPEPASAAPRRRDLLARGLSGVLLLGLMAVPALSTTAAPDDVGAVEALEVDAAAPASAGASRTAARDQRLRRGCRAYGYRYALVPPGEEWMLETVLVAPSGERVGSATFVSGVDPTQQRASFRLCRSSVDPGRYRLRALATWRDGWDESEQRLRTTRFRLTRR